MVKDMEIKEIPVDIIHVNPWNPNVMPQSTLDHLKQEYSRVGYLQPIVVRPKQTPGGLFYEVIDGEHRMKAAVDMGMTKLKCVVVEMDDEQAKITTINLNRIKGADDPFKLTDLLKDLNTTLDLTQLSSILNMPMTELETMFELSDATEDILKDKPTSVKYIIVPENKKPGDKIYLDSVDVYKDEGSVKGPVSADKKEPNV